MCYDYNSKQGCDTIMGLPEFRYHLGQIPDKIIIGENGYIEKVIRTNKWYKKENKKEGYPGGVIYEKSYIIYSYDDKWRISSKSYQKNLGIENRRVEFVYDERGLLKIF